MARKRLSDSDSLLWRMEADPLLRLPVLVVALLDRRPTDDGVRATIERACATVPQLRQRIVDPPLGLGPPRWVDADGVSYDHHVRRQRLPEGGDLRAVLDLVEPDAVSAFDPARPLWSMRIVDGIADGSGDRSAVVLRFHHAITDGVGAIALAERIFDSTRRPRRIRQAAGAASDDGERPDEPGTPAPGGVAALGQMAGSLLRTTAAAIRHPATALTGPLRLARSTVRVLAPTPPGGSPLLRGRGLDRRLDAFAVPFAGLRAAADRVGATVNDVLLAAVGGGIDRYHRERGSPVGAVRVTMPVSIRRPDDPAGGNRFAPARFVLPVDDPDPAVRARIAHAIVRAWRSEPALAGTDLLAAGLNVLPRPVVTRLFGGLLRDRDVNVSNVPGLRHFAYIGGARIERMWAFAPVSGAAFSVTLVSNADSGNLAIMCDRAAVEDPDRLARHVREAVGEVVALGGSP